MSKCLAGRWAAAPCAGMSLPPSAANTACVLRRFYDAGITGAGFFLRPDRDVGGGFLGAASGAKRSSASREVRKVSA